MLQLLGPIPLKRYIRAEFPEYVIVWTIVCFVGTLDFLHIYVVVWIPAHRGSYGSNSPETSVTAWNRALLLRDHRKIDRATFMQKYGQIRMFNPKTQFWPKID